MRKLQCFFAALIMLTPLVVMAETIEGTLDAVSFNEQMITVSGEVYEVNTEITRVIYQGEALGEEDLRPGDDVILVIGEQSGPDGKRLLEMVILLRGSKPGLDS